MATRYAVATGNWSATATWNGGTLPTSADDVYANTFTVTIDQNVTVLSLRTTSTTGVTQGGGFVCSGSYTINATSGGFVGVSSGCLALSPSSGISVVTNGLVSGGGVVGGACISYTGAGSWTHSGNSSAGFNSNSFYINGTGVVNITSNMTISGGSSTGAFINNAATVTITGIHSGSSLNNTVGGQVEISGAANVTLIGSVTGSANSGIASVYLRTSASTLTISGSLIGATGYAVYSAISSPTVTFTGPFYCSATGLMPFYCPCPVKLTGISNNEFRFLKSTTGTTSLFSGDVTSLSPSPSDVRSGTVFGVNNSYTGTMAVPPANSVASGVAVDNTTGTAALTPSDIAAVTGAQLAALMNSTP